MQSLFQEHLVFIFLLYWIGSGGEANIVLTHVPVEVEENRSVVLSCYSTADPINDVMSWVRNGQSFWVNVTDSPCRAITYPWNETDVYTFNCSGIHNFSLTIRNVDRLQHGDQWQCFIGFSRSNVVTLYVKVPVDTLDLMFTDQGIIAENQTSRFQCTSSFSRPKPDIFWFLSNGTTTFYDDIHLNSNIIEALVNKTVGNRTGNILTSTESELVLKVQRSMNNQQIYCLSNNTSGRILRSTLKILNIAYYRVVYNNSVEGNTNMFQISVADLPDPPKYFDYLNDSLTSTQVTVFWTKGHGGGLKQTFVLNISQTSQPIKYDYINETENEYMQHTITGLSGGTRYQLTLWATNMLGKSLSQTLSIITKEGATKTTSSSKTAVIAGSVSSLVGISVVASVIFLLYKRRYKKKTDGNNEERSGTLGTISAL